MIVQLADGRADDASAGTRLRVGIFGGALKNDPSVRFARMFGASLAHTSFMVCHTGWKGRDSSPEHLSVPFARATVEGMAEVLPAEQLHERVMTVLTSTRASALRRAFRIGTVLELGLHRKTDCMPAISMSHVVCVGGGATGVQDIFQKATALRIPALPLPFFGGMARNLFFRYSEQMARNFRLPEERIRSWSRTKLEQTSPDRMTELARAVAQSLVEVLRRRCLVFMPFTQRFFWVFDRVIRPAADRSGFDAIRLDLQAFAGDIGNQVRQELAVCDCVLAVITAENANVLYEVGFAHAIGKDVIFLSGREEQRSGTTDLPFYIRNHRTLFYPTENDGAAILDAVNALATELTSKRLSPGASK